MTTPPMMSETDRTSIYAPSAPKVNDPHVTPDPMYCLDVGAYHGQWAIGMVKRHGARVDAFEPISETFATLCHEIRAYPSIRPYNFGVASVDRMESLFVRNDSSGAFQESEKSENCRMMALSGVLARIGVRMVDVLKLNCEGTEYEILRAALIATDAFGPQINRFRNIQVQFHTFVPNYESLYAGIAGDLSATHELTHRTPFVWENWRIKEEK